MNGLTVIPFSPALVPEIIRTWLEHKADAWFVWLLIATIALFVGILMDERAERILPMRYRITDDGSALEDERSSGWQNRLRTFGFWLAVASIIGEGIFEFLGARAEGRVREFANTRVVIAQQEASLANERSALAIERGEQLGHLLDREREATRALANELAAARVSQLELTNGQRRLVAELAAERETNLKRQREVARLNDRLDRSIKGDVPDWIAEIDKLRKFSGQNLNFIVYPDDGEVALIAGSIRNMLHEAGWNLFTPRAAKDKYTSPPLLDVWIEVPRQSQRDIDSPDGRAAQALLDFMLDERIMVNGLRDPPKVGGTAAGDIELKPNVRLTMIIGKRR